MKHAYQVMLKLHGRLIAPFLLGSMSVRMNILVCHLVIDLSHVMRNLFMLYANNKGADQPAHPRSLISAFVVRCLDKIIPLVFISEIASLYLASVVAQAGLSLTRSKIPKTGFLVTLLIYEFDLWPG